MLSVSHCFCRMLTGQRHSKINITLLIRFSLGFEIFHTAVVLATLDGREIRFGEDWNPGMSLGGAAKVASVMSWPTPFICTSYHF